MEKFEQDIEKKLAGFSIAPSPQVWKDVETALHGRRKKRFAFWLWLPITFICAGLLWLLFINGQKTEQATAFAKKGTGNKTKAPNTAIMQEGKHPVTEPNIFANSNQARYTVDTKHTQESNKSNAFLNTSNGITKVAFTTGKANAIKQNKMLTESEKQAAFVTNAQSDSDTKNNKLPSTTVSTKRLDSLSTKDSTISTKTASKTASLETDSIAVKQSIKKAIEKNSKHQWYIVGGTGICLVKNSTLFSSNAANFYPTNSSPILSSPGTSSSSNTIHIQSPNTGLSFLVGIHYEKILNKHWSVVSGVQYRYIQTNQTIADSAYKPIKTETNHAHWLQLPLNIQYTFNAFAGHKFQLLAGTSIAWAFSEKWLAVQSARSYTYDKTLNNTLLFNLNAGIGMLSKQGYKFGLVVEQGLAAIHKKENKSYYLQQYSFQVSVPLVILSKTKK